MHQPLESSTKDLEMFEYIQMLVLRPPQSPDMPREEKIMRKSEKDLEYVPSSNFSPLLSKLKEELIFGNTELNYLKNLQVKSEQVSLIADLLIEKASFEKEMCAIIINLLLQEVMSARLRRIIAEEPGMLEVLLTLITMCVFGTDTVL